MDADMASFPRIQGNKGWLEITNAYAYSGVHLKAIGGSVHVDTTSQGDTTMHFQIEVEHFANDIRTGTAPATPGEEGLHDMLAIEVMYKAAGTRSPDPQPAKKRRDEPGLLASRRR